MQIKFWKNFIEFIGKYDLTFKTDNNNNGLFHFESLVALDNLSRLKNRLDHYNAKLEDFIGTEEAKQRTLDFYTSQTL